MGVRGPRGDGQLLPAADTPKARLGPGLHPRGDPGLLPQCSHDRPEVQGPRDIGMGSEQTACCPL